MSLWAALEQAVSLGGTPLVMPAFLGNIGGSEILLILLLVLLVFGPKQLPEVAKTLGKTLKGVRKAADELRHEAGLDEAMRETRQIGNSLKRTVYASIESPPESEKSAALPPASPPGADHGAAPPDVMAEPVAETGSQPREPALPVPPSTSPPPSLSLTAEVAPIPSQPPSSREDA